MKVAIVTGASRGLGAAVAESLASSGFSVAICSSSDAVFSVEKRISGIGGFCSAHVVDVRVESQVKGFVEAVLREFGGVDVLVNNAGYCHGMALAEQIPVDEYKACMETNVDSVFFFMRHLLPAMRKEGSGIVINISSGAGRKGYPRLSVYSASKFAVQGISEAVAREVEGTGLRCISVLPGGINTGMRALLFGRDDAAAQQSPVQVAGIIRDIILGKTHVKNGSSVHVRQGKITEINEMQ